MAKGDELRVMTPEFMVSYPAVFEKKMTPSGKDRFSIQMVFDKTNTDLGKMKKAAQQCAINKWGADKNKWPKGMRKPFRDGDVEDKGEMLHGKIFVNAATDYKPGLVNQDREPIISDEDFYAGCFARATVVPFAYNTAGNSGVSFGLRNIQLIRKGDRIGGGIAAEDEFESLASDSYEADSNNDDDF